MPMSSLPLSLRFHLLNAPRLECDGAPVAIDRRKAVALLAYLVLTGQAHLRDTLATLLWPDSGQSLRACQLTPHSGYAETGLGRAPSRHWAGQHCA